jgi:hypothetical protein
MQELDSPDKGDELSCQSPAHKHNCNKAKEVKKVPADGRPHRLGFVLFWLGVLLFENEREQLLSRF